MAVSLSAQLLLFPLSIYYFHQFSNYFLFSNLLILPLVEIIVSLGFLFFLATSVPIIQKWLGFSLDYTIRLVNYLVQKIALIPLAKSENLVLNELQCVLLFSIIIFTILLFTSKKKNYAYYILCLSSVLFVSFVRREYTIRNNTHKYIVFRWLLQR